MFVEVLIHKTTEEITQLLRLNEDASSEALKKNVYANNCYNDIICTTKKRVYGMTYEQMYEVIPRVCDVPNLNLFILDFKYRGMSRGMEIAIVNWLIQHRMTKFNLVSMKRKAVYIDQLKRISRDPVGVAQVIEYTTQERIFISCYPERLMFNSLCSKSISLLLEAYSDYRLVTGDASLAKYIHAAGIKKLFWYTMYSRSRANLAELLKNIEELTLDYWAVYDKQYETWKCLRNTQVKKLRIIRYMGVDKAPFELIDRLTNLEEVCISCYAESENEKVIQKIRGRYPHLKVTKIKHTGRLTGYAFLEEISEEQ